MLPNFFIVGAPKAGTTSLYNYLDQHPQVFMSPNKEPCYFASEVRAENFAGKYQHYHVRTQSELNKYLRNPVRENKFRGIVSEWEDYVRLFDGAGLQRAVGEASVCYLHSPTAARNIAARIPHAKIIIVLRDPAERAYSRYLHMVAEGHVRRPFREHIRISLTSQKEKFDTFYPFLEYGMYHGQVRTYMSVFPPENVRVYFYQEGLAGIVADVFRFLNADPRDVDLSRRYLDRTTAPQATAFLWLLKEYNLLGAILRWTPASIRPVFRRMVFRNRKPPEMNEDDRRFLRDYYREDVVKLAGLLDRDLSSWID